MSFMEWVSDSCHCILAIPTKPYDESKAKFRVQCRTHDRVSETFAHNRSFNGRDGKTPTDPQREQQITDKHTERDKPEFQRR